MPSIQTVRCVRLLLVLAISVFVAPAADGSDWLSGSGWPDWMGPTDWQTLTVRGQEDSLLSMTPTQPSMTERAPGFGGPRRRRAAAPGAEPAPAAIDPVAPTPTETAEEGVSPQDFTVEQAPDLGAAIAKSNKVQTVNFRQRSPLSREPYVRGYGDGSVYTLADGSYWAPIRPDLDSMINRIDPSLFEDVSIVAGPYGLRYGPGFSFVRILTQSTPRYANGYESRYRTGFSTRTNGGQVFGRQTVMGGSCDWGYIFQYGNRVGGDYRPGGNSLQTPVPGSYKSQSLLGQLGFDLSPNSRLEFRYRRLDDTDSQYALQFFDVDALRSDAYSLHYSYDDPCDDSTTSAMAWYSNSVFDGDTLPRLNSEYYTVARVEAALLDALSGGVTPPPSVSMVGTTGGHHSIMGARVNRSYGDPDCRQLSIGADIRYNNQRLLEEFTFDVAALPDFHTNLPLADMVDTGIYSEFTLRWLPYLKSTVGGRVDWVNTSTREREFRGRAGQGAGPSNLEIYAGGLRQSDLLLSFYLANDLEISECWSVRLAGGYGQRSPTLLERYADGIFLGLVQSGLSRVIGTPTLTPEDTWQADLALNYLGENWRGRAAVFYGWTDDPITFLGFPAVDPTGARLLRYINGNLFTRTGFELWGEWDLWPRITTFGTLRYLSGRDRNIVVAGAPGPVDRPMTSIYPLESRAGVRLHDAEGGRRWGCEVGVRMVASQDSVGSLRLGSTNVVQLLDDFEQRTGGFTTVDLRGYLNVTEGLYVVCGIENLFDRTYLEHLNLRLPADTIGTSSFPYVGVQSPGITPYFGVEWNY